MLFPRISALFLGSILGVHSLSSRLTSCCRRTIRSLAVPCSILAFLVGARLLFPSPSTAPALRRRMLCFFLVNSSSSPSMMTWHPLSSHGSLGFVRNMLGGRSHGRISDTVTDMRTMIELPLLLSRCLRQRFFDRYHTKRKKSWWIKMCPCGEIGPSMLRGAMSREPPRRSIVQHIRKEGAV